MEPDGDSWLLEEPLDAPEPPMLEPDWVCAKAENARSAAAVAVQRIFSFMEMFLLRGGWDCAALYANSVPLAAR